MNLKYGKENRAKLSELNKAIYDFAVTYCNTGCEWEEAVEHANFIVSQFGGRDVDDDTMISRLYSESIPYEDM